MKERKPQKKLSQEMPEKSLEGEKKHFGGKIITLLSKYKLLILVLILSVSFLPKISSAENAVGMRAVVTGIGIDKIDDKFKITAQVFIPGKGETTGAHAKSIVSVSIDTIAEIEDKLTLRIGRVTTLYHCDLVILGMSLLESDCLPPIGYLTGNGILSYSAIVQATDGNAEEVVRGISELEQTASFSWKDFLNDAKGSARNIHLDLLTFINNCRGKGKSSYITVANMTEAEVKGKGAEESESKEKEQSDTPTKQLDEKIKLFMIKNGKYTGALNEEEAAGISWLERSSKQKIITLKLQGIKPDAVIPVEIKDKKLKTKYYFKDNIPCLGLDFKISIKQTDIYNEDEESKISGDEREKLKDLLIKSLKEQVENDVKLTLKKCAEVDTDCINIIPSLHKFALRDFNNYLKTNDENSILDNLELEIKVDILITANARLSTL